MSNLTIGVDLGDRVSRIYGVDSAGVRAFERAIATTPPALREFFGNLPASRVVLEVGMHSPWVASDLKELGHEVYVANPSAMYGKGRRRQRNDRMDAEFLARQGRADPKLLHAIQHRGKKARTDLALLRARDTVVRARTRLINHVRGAVKPMGARLRRTSAESFGKRALENVPAELQPALAPVIEMINQLTAQIRKYDEQIQELIVRDYAEATQLQQIPGVGPLTALAFVLLIDDPRRFDSSRDAGAYFGLCPKLDESSDYQPQLHISKAGDEMGRRLLVSAARYILGPFGPECDLRRYGNAIAARGGKNARARAAVAVARKLAVVLHKLWISGGAYDPERLAKRRAA